MSTLKLTSKSGAITGASIDDAPVDGFLGVTQRLERGTIKTTISVDFDKVEITQGVGPAANLPGAFSPGNTIGTTKYTISGAATQGTSLAYTIADTEIATPTLGDVITGSQVYTSGTEITTTVGKCVAIYELETGNKCCRFHCDIMTAADIKQENPPAPIEAPALPGSFSPGSVTGSTSFARIGAAPVGTKLVTTSSSTELAIPKVGASFTGTDYTSGVDIAGVTVNDYRSVCELDSSSKVTRYTCKKLTVDDIKQPASGVLDLAATFAPGDTNGSTQATYDDTPGQGNSFKYLVSDTVVIKPAIDDVIATGSYTLSSSGGNMYGVDLDKYVVLCEFTPNDTAVQFICHKLVASEVTRPDSDKFKCTFAPGTVVGATTIVPTETISTGNKIHYAFSDTNIDTPPRKGTAVSGKNVYVLGSDIPNAVVDKYLAVYETDSADGCERFVCHKLVAADILADTPVVIGDLEAAFSPGTAVGSTKATVSVGSGNNLRVKVGTMPITKPTTDAPITGLASYKSGDDLVDVDTVNKKYVTLYECDADLKPINFICHTLVYGEIRVPSYASNLNLTVTAGSVDGTTSAEIYPAITSDQSAFYKLTSTRTETPLLDAVIDTTGLTALVNNADIVATRGQYLSAYKLDKATSKCKEFGNILLEGYDVNGSPEDAAELTGILRNGNAVGTTRFVVTDTQAEGQSLVYNLTPDEVFWPTVADTMEGTPYVSNGDIVVGDNTYITICHKTTATNIITKVYQRGINFSDVTHVPPVPVPSLDAVLMRGGAPGSTKLLIMNGGEAFGTQLSYEVVDTPATNPLSNKEHYGLIHCESRKDLTEDIVVGKYICFYEVAEASNYCNRFICLELTADVVNS